MLLNVQERLIAVNILPQKGDLPSLRKVKKIKEETEFSQEEIQELGLGMPCKECGAVSQNHTPEDKHTYQRAVGMVTWDAKKDAPVEVQLDKEHIAFLLSCLRDLNQKKELTLEIMALFERLEEEQKNG